jgi:hypothetical protein
MTYRSGDEQHRRGWPGFIHKGLEIHGGRRHGRHTDSLTHVHLDSALQAVRAHRLWWHNNSETILKKEYDSVQNAGHKDHGTQGTHYIQIQELKRYRVFTSFIQCYQLSSIVIITWSTINLWKAFLLN